MLAANCSFYGCSTSRYSPDIAIFSLPRSEDVCNTNWRNQLVNIIIKGRVGNKSLKSQIKKKNLHILNFTLKKIISEDVSI